jgi:hypothetical protein
MLWSEPVQFEQQQIIRTQEREAQRYSEAFFTRPRAWMSRLPSSSRHWSSGALDDQTVSSLSTQADQSKRTALDDQTVSRLSTERAHSLSRRERKLQYSTR